LSEYKEEDGKIIEILKKDKNWVFVWNDNHFSFSLKSLSRQQNFFLNTITHTVENQKS
jgi:hypothetical protein